MDFISINIAEWVGYIATAVLLTSFTMKQLRTLRIVNSVACLLFVGYGVLLTNAWPIIISNAAIFVINIYYLFLEKNQ
ncbi:MAG: uroporphyrinogen decarboxylase [Bacteroidetes bacterium]|jgi:CHASE2 domain-containing sensor protein|nr:uroporphyrinogen decarboxylase [Bacteroidota bacterium]MDA1176664.1 uroporphyrinogen decarboxylase [Bacteroidota bacterium]